MLKRQLMFDTAVAALYKQGKPSLDKSGDLCQYRAPDGGKCAVGHLIPDRRYSKELEGQTANRDQVREAIGAKYGKADFTGQEADFLRDMQAQLHDELSFGNNAGPEFRGALRLGAVQFAKQYGLKVDANLFKG